MKQDPKNANKPEAILEKIAEGKMRKFFEENTLLALSLIHIWPVRSASSAAPTVPRRST